MFIRIFIFQLVFYNPLSAGILQDPLRYEFNIAIYLDQTLLNRMINEFGLNWKSLERQVLSYIDQINLNLIGLKTNKVKRVSLNYKRLLNFTQPHSGDITSLLSEFCIFQAIESDSELQRHWDFAMLLTDLDLFEQTEIGELNFDVTGISPVGGIQWTDLSCALVEFNTGYHSDHLVDSAEGRVYPTRSIGGSALVGAHEFAHNLGIHHDGWPFELDCDENGWIMGPSGGSRHKPQGWSECSRRALDRLELGKFMREEKKGSDKINLPGQAIDLNFQCRFFSNKTLLKPSNQNGNICNETAWCENLKIGSLVPIGIPLDGTSCGKLKICLLGNCVDISAIKDMSF